MKCVSFTRGAGNQSSTQPYVLFSGSCRPEAVTLARRAQPGRQKTFRTPTPVLPSTLGEPPSVVWASKDLSPGVALQSMIESTRVVVSGCEQMLPMRKCANRSRTGDSVIGTARGGGGSSKKWAADFSFRVQNARPTFTSKRSLTGWYLPTTPPACHLQRNPDA